jgi:hypothetical protein
MFLAAIISEPACRVDAAEQPKRINLKGGNIMRVKLAGFIVAISTIFVLGSFLNVWSVEQKEEKESYKKQTEEKIKALDKKLNELKVKAAEVKGDAKEEFNKEMTDLRKKQTAAKKKWRELKKAGAKKWEKVKSEMSAAVQDVENTYDKVASRFKEKKE